MTTTTAAYLSVMNNLSNMQKATAAEPAVKTATAYYAANIGNVTSIDDFVGNYRLLSYALDAYGLGDQINNTALIKQVLQGGVASSSSLANTLPKWTAFATAFNFAAAGASAATSSTSISTTESNYVEEQLESDQGQTGLTRRQVQHGLTIKRRVNDRADDRADAEKPGADHGAGDAIAQDHDGNERLARGQKPQHEQAPQHGRRGKQREHLPRAPRIMRAAPGERQHQQ